MNKDVGMEGAVVYNDGEGDCECAESAETDVRPNALEICRGSRGLDKDTCAGNPQRPSSPGAYPHFPPHTGEEGAPK